MKYNYAIKNLGPDPNIKLYTNLIDANAERNRREAYGIPCEIQDREAWDKDVMQYAEELIQNEE